MDYCIQILCRFQKCQRKVPPLSPPNFFFTFFSFGPPAQVGFEKKIMRNGGGALRLHFWNLHKIWI